MSEVASTSRPSSTKSIIDFSTLLPKNLTPADVCERYFGACRDKDPNVWLATLHLERREEATSQRPGPFDTLHWDLGRARCNKYQVTYHLLTSSEVYAQGANSAITLMYEPRYGPVPGYAQGASLGGTIAIVLRMESEEWRVVSGGF